MASNISTAFSAEKRRSGSRSSLRNTAYVEHPRTSGGHNYYHLSEDLADDAIGWLRQHKAFDRDKPFLMYWAPGASHGPFHVPKNGPISIRASLTTAGTNTASASSSVRSRWVGYRPMRN